MRYFSLLLMLLCYHPSFAEEATSCIKIGQTGGAQSIKNTCKENVWAFWCLDTGVLKDSACGQHHNYYQQFSILRQGKSVSNPETTPLGVKIRYGACAGKEGQPKTYSVVDELGNYICAWPISESSDLTAFNVTAAGSSKDEACSIAKEIAKDASASECYCDQRGNTHICRVEVTGPKPDEPLAAMGMKKLRALDVPQKAREFEGFINAQPALKLPSGCKQMDVWCTSLKRPVAFGVRG